MDSTYIVLGSMAYRVEGGTGSVLGKVYSAEIKMGRIAYRVDGGTSTVLGTK